MIINCENCNKNFNLDNNLIGKSGRLLQCGRCNHKWFYKPLFEDFDKIEDADKINDLNLTTNISSPEEKQNDLQNKKKSKIPKEKKLIKSNLKKKNNNNYISIFFVILISFISLLIVFDTFKEKISIFLPGIKPLFENLYDTLYNLLLFIKDLFN